MNYMDRQFLIAQGFEGFKTMGELMNGERYSIPDQMGVYIVLRESETAPEFLTEGTGGFFKGQNPNVPIAELQAKWVANSSIVYIGKAGGIGSSATLQKRLGQYLRFGQGANIGHWGGRYLWQLVDSRELIVCWKPLTKDDPREIERKMIADFKSAHDGMRPFANLID